MSRRIDVVFMATTGERRPDGSKGWFAERVRVSKRTVESWCAPPDAASARDPEDPRVYATLRRLERGVAAARLSEAEARLRLRSPLSVEEVYAIRHLIDEGESLSEVARRFGVDTSTVSKIGNRIRWPSLPEKQATPKIKKLAKRGRADAARDLEAAAAAAATAW
jgi:DNA-binding transcriptional regulator YiaG